MPSPSPYAAVSSQPIKISAAKASAEKVESASPYAVTPTESLESRSAPNGGPTPVTLLDKGESSGQLQPAKFTQG